MNDHSPSTLRCRSASEKVRARSTVPSHSHVDVDQFDTAHPHRLQPDQAKLRPGEIHVVDEGVIQVDVTEGGPS
jgi:hypothetical protein